VQAYQKRARTVIDWLYALANGSTAASWCAWSRAPIGTPRSSARRTAASPGYPVFTRKANTDVSYLACAGKLLDDGPHLSAIRHPQRAHGRRHPVDGRRDRTTSSSSACTAWARRSARDGAQAQRARAAASMRRSGRIRDLLAYLVRRLLENGANSSFVHQLTDEAGRPRGHRPDPLEATVRGKGGANPSIPTAGGDLTAPAAQCQGLGRSDRCR
jgi:RHH-type proline utilization regulon transcriptional repressor/proline dehydrogenase/delta 1-pyrroline-5-carboxylate dehydrogenase